MNFTLSASGWSGSSAPYVYTIENNHCEVNSIISVSLQPNVTIEHVKEFGKALIIGGTQQNGSFNLIALKNKPSIDIPITITIGGVIDGN